VRIIHLRTPNSFSHGQHLVHDEQQGEDQGTAGRKPCNTLWEC
jgi:hypothetical protein